MRAREGRVAELTSEALRLSALDMKTQIRSTLIDFNPTGNPYVRYKPRREGVAGRRWAEPPHWDEGTLGGKSIFHRPPIPETFVEIGTDRAYGRILEENGWRWLGLSWDRMLPRILLRLRNAARGVHL